MTYNWDCTVYACTILISNKKLIFSKMQTHFNQQFDCFYRRVHGPYYKCLYMFVVSSGALISINITCWVWIIQIFFSSWGCAKFGNLMLLLEPLQKFLGTLLVSYKTSINIILQFREVMRIYGWDLRFPCGTILEYSVIVICQYQVEGLLGAIVMMDDTSIHHVTWAAGLFTMLYSPDINL